MQHNGTGHSESDEMRGQRDQETSEPQTKTKITQRIVRKYEFLYKICKSKFKLYSVCI